MLKIILYIILISTHIFPQIYKNINFNNLNPDILICSPYLYSNISVLSNDVIATNYGDSLDYRKTSLYTLFDKDGEFIKFSFIEKIVFNAMNVRVYQVSETQSDSLIVEGWLNYEKKYSMTFLNINTWKTLELNYNMINEIKIKSANYINTNLNYDYNFGSLNILMAVGKIKVFLN